MTNDNTIHKNIQYIKKSLYKTSNRTKNFGDLKHLICAKDKRRNEKIQTKQRPINNEKKKMRQKC